jgi:hypothetical protein
MQNSLWMVTRPQAAPSTEDERRITLNLDIKSTLAAFALPRRFHENSVDLTTLRHTPAFTGDEDQFWLQDVVVGKWSEAVPQAVITFEPPPLTHEDILERPTDAIASSITRITAEPSPDMPGGFRTTVGFDMDRFLAVANVLQRESNHLSRVLESILSNNGMVHLQTAQQLGHTLRMVSLNKVLSLESGRPGLSFIVPNADNVKLCERELQEGAALAWRQLFEPGYCLDHRLIFPMDPDAGSFFQTVVLAATLNRHVLAMAMAAILSGCRVLWTNDARHEGPALFRALCDWLIENRARVQGDIRLYQLAYLILDPLDHVPEKLQTRLREAKKDLVKKAKQMFPGLQIADGLEFMRHKMYAQAVVSDICDKHSLPAKATTLYMSAFPSGDLRTDLLDGDAKDLILQQRVVVIPEIASGIECQARIVDSAFVTLGMSGHSHIRQIVSSIAAMAASNAQMRVTLVGKGTDSHSVRRILGGKPPENMAALGVVQEREHDQLMAGADVVVVKTTRNTRAAIAPALSRGQGVLLIPPGTGVPESLKTLYQVSYFFETAIEHLTDLELALALLKQLGVDDPQDLVLDADSDLVSQFRRAKQAAAMVCRGALKRMGTPTDLARVILSGELGENTGLCQGYIGGYEE